MNRQATGIYTIILIFFIIFTVKTSHAQSPGDAILQKVDGIGHPSTYEVYFQIINTLPNGKTKQFTAYAAKELDGAAAVLIVAPETQRGRAVMRLGEEVWTHIPGETKLRKSTLRHAIVGGVFNNGDYLQATFAKDHKAELLLESNDNYTLRLTPKVANFLPYSTMNMVVEKASLRPISMVQFAAPDVIIKSVEIDYSRLADDGKTALPTITTTAEDNSLYRSTIRVGNIRERKFPAATFSKENLPRFGSVLK